MWQGRAIAARRKQRRKTQKEKQEEDEINWATVHCLCNQTTKLNFANILSNGHWIKLPIPQHWWTTTCKHDIELMSESEHAWDKRCPDKIVTVVRTMYVASWRNIVKQCLLQRNLNETISHPHFPYTHFPFLLPCFGDYFISLLISSCLTLLLLHRHHDVHYICFVIVLFVVTLLFPPPLTRPSSSLRCPFLYLLISPLSFLPLLSSVLIFFMPLLSLWISNCSFVSPFIIFSYFLLHLLSVFYK